MQNTEPLILCPIHHNEIVLLDIEIGIPLGQRACCKECSFNKAHQINLAKEKINKMRLEETQIINFNIYRTLEELEEFQKHFQSFFEEICSEFQNIFDSIKQKKNELLSSLKNINQIRIQSLTDLQNLALMICDLTNNKYNNQQVEFNFNLQDYLGSLENKLRQIQNNFYTFKISTKTTQIQQEQQIIFKNNYQLRSSYKLDYWINTMIFNQQKNRVALCFNNGISELSIENCKFFFFQNIIQHDQMTHVSLGLNNNWILVASKRGQQGLITVYVKDNQNWRVCFQVGEHKQQINSILINEKRSQVISGGMDSLIVVWKKTEQYQLIQQEILREHKKGVTSLGLSQSGDILASGSGDLSLIIWKINEGRWKKDQEIANKNQKFICNIVFDQYDNIFTASENVKIWKQNNQNQYILSSTIQIQNIKQLLFNQQQQQLIILCGNIEIWKMLNEIVHKQTIQGDYFNIAISNDGQYLVAQQYSDQQLQLFSLIEQ